MLPKNQELTVILIALVVGSLIICYRYPETNAKFLDLAQTGLGGYLALMVQSERSKSKIVDK